MFKTNFCDLIGIKHPILNAPMGPDISGVELAAAVSNAGGLGMLQAQFCPPDVFRSEIRRLRELTNKPFGVNLLIYLPHEDNLQVCIEERIPFLSFFWGDPSEYVDDIHKAGIKVGHQTGSVAAAVKSVNAGVDIIIAQGLEAGGHVEGDVTTMTLVPRMVDAVTPTPVLAAGGIADARGLVAALALGAEAAVLGTRFLASHESNAHSKYKDHVINANEDDTVKTILFGHSWPNSPHRTLRTPFVEEWLDKELETQNSDPNELILDYSTIGGRSIPIPRFMSVPPNVSIKQNIDSMAFLMGQSAGLVKDIKPAEMIVKELISDAEKIVAKYLKG